MKRCIIIFFVWRQVDVLILLALVVLLLVHIIAGTALTFIIDVLLLAIIVAFSVSIRRLLVVVQIVLHIINNYNLFFI